MDAEDRDIQRLAVAVLSLAWADARMSGRGPHPRRLRDRATAWIRLGGEGFRWWCEIARINADAFRRAALNDTRCRLRRHHPPRRVA
jgi:hypothetical protein